MKKNILKDRPKVLVAFFLIAVGVGERIFFDLGPNIELVTMVTILSALYLGRNFAIAVPLIVLAISDSVLGNTRIMIFTWSAFIFEGGVLFLVNKLIHFQRKKTIIKLFLAPWMGVGTSFWFYLWTNFGVWLLDSWGMYSRDLRGLISCYIMGIPFLKLNLLGNIIFPLLGIASFEMIASLSHRIIPRKNWRLLFS